MDSSFLEKQSLELKAAAKDFQRLIDQQIALYTQEKENHDKIVEDLNSLYMCVITYDLERIQETTSKLSKLEEKQKNKEENLKLSIEEIEKIQNEIESLRVRFCLCFDM